MRIKLEGFEQAMESFSPKIVNRAGRLSVKEAAAAAKSETAVALSLVWNIPRAKITQTLTVRSVFGGLTQEVVVSGSPIGLAHFNARQVVGNRVVVRDKKTGMLKSNRMRGYGPQFVGVIVEVERGHKTILQTAFMRDLRQFAGRSKGGNVLFGSTVSARVLSRFKGKLWAAKTPSIASMFKQARIKDRVIARAREVLQRRFFHHLERLTTGPSPT